VFSDLFELLAVGLLDLFYLFFVLAAQNELLSQFDGAPVCSEAL